MTKKVPKDREYKAGFKLRALEIAQKDFEERFPDHEKRFSNIDYRQANKEGPLSYVNVGAIGIADGGIYTYHYKIDTKEKKILEFEEGPVYFGGLKEK